MSNVTSMDLAKLDTSNATDRRRMFFACKDLKSLADLDVSGFDMSKVESVAKMFSHCKSLRDLDLSSFDDSGIKYGFYDDRGMNDMFSGCWNLEHVVLGRFDKASSHDLFPDCYNLPFDGVEFPEPVSDRPLADVSGLPWADDDTLPESQ